MREKKAKITTNHCFTRRNTPVNHSAGQTIIQSFIEPTDHIITQALDLAGHEKQLAIIEIKIFHQALAHISL